MLLDVVDYGQQLGLDMSYGDHEDAPGQLELNFRFDRPLRTADNITTYRQICAAVGRKYDLLPSFMPKPFTGVSANGHHHHFTLIDNEGRNVFHDPDGPAQLSGIACHFLGGMLDHFPALMCVGNPTVNSYCRMWDTGFWAPILQELGAGRTARRRCASRPVSASSTGRRLLANPYRRSPRCSAPDSTASAARATRAAAAGQHLRPAARGREHREGPRQPRRGARGARRRRGHPQRDAGRLYKVFNHYKRDEWERYLAAVTDWERDEYLEVLP